MTRKKSKKAAQKKQKTPSRPDPEIKSAVREGFFSGERTIEYVLTGLTVAYLIFLVFKLYSFLEITYFWSDENVHAYISSIILKTGSLPAVLPDDIYGGYEYGYPPFFHILGAIFMGVAGFPALKYFNFILLILFFIGFYVLIRKYYGSSQALLACLLISLPEMIMTNTVRHMTEMLSMVLIFGSFFFLALAVKEAKLRFSILAGLSTGLLLLSKQIGIVVLGFYCLLLVWFYFKSKKDVKPTLYAICISVAMYTPYLIWAIYNQVEVFGFLSVFFGTKPEWATEAVKTFRKSESSLWEFGYHFYTGNGLVFTVSFLVPLFHYLRTRGKDRPHNYGFLMTIYLAGVMVAWHITNARHTITLLPLMAFLFGYSFSQVVTNKAAKRAAIVLLLIFGIYNALTVPNLRERFNGPEDPIKFAMFIKKDKTADGRTLVIQAFDYLMYSGKPTIWPYANLRNIPLNLFEKQSPDKLYAVLKEYNIDYIVVDMRFVSEADILTIHKYPLPFLRNCESLDHQGLISLVGKSASNIFLLLRVH